MTPRLWSPPAFRSRLPPTASDWSPPISSRSAVPTLIVWLPLTVSVWLAPMLADMLSVTASVWSAPIDRVSLLPTLSVALLPAETDASFEAFMNICSEPALSSIRISLVDPPPGVVAVWTELFVLCSGSE